jgi:hypothetical protein
MGASAFFLSMVSPVLRSMLCGTFRESAGKQMELDEVDRSSFRHLLDMACGRGVQNVRSLHGVLRIAQLADRFQVSLL